MILLDTNTLVCWVNGSAELSAAARAAIETESTASGTLWCRPISAWEIAMLIEKGRLSLDRDVRDGLDQTDLVA